MTAYLIESTLGLAVMLLLYRLVLSGTSMHQLKRFYLLACLVLPLTLPLLQFDLYYGETEVIPVVSDTYESTNEISQVGGTDFRPSRRPILNTQDTVQDTSKTDWRFWLALTYLLVAASLLIRFLLNIFRIWRLSKQSDSAVVNGFRLILLQASVTPYSFFRLIFMAREDYSNALTREPLLSHELAHARQLHSLDILSLELLRIVFWFNPLYLLLGKCIRLNHEYIADAQVLSQFGDRKTYQRLLLNFASRTQHYSPLVSPSNFSFIKNRFSMMHKTTSKKAVIIRVSLLVTAIAGTLFSFGMELKPRPVVYTEPIPTSIDQAIARTAKATTPSGIPVDSVRYTSNIQGASQAFNLRLDDNYPGIDVTARHGRNVISTADGTVEEAKSNDPRYGNYVLISHVEGLKTLYASLGRVDVEKGQKVTQGDRLGIIGVSMPTSALPGKIHRVHYAVSESDEWVNPYKFINQPTSNLQVGTVNGVDAIVPWAYPRALDITKRPETRPDLSPLIMTEDHYMAFVGFIPKGSASINSIYDSSIGTEFFSPPGTTVRATASGTVTELEEGHERYGTYIKVKHDDVHETLYAKLDEVLVKPGQQLHKGEAIARIGTANDMFGRMHYKVIRNNKFVTPGQYTSQAGPKGPRLKLSFNKPKKTSFNWDFPAGLSFKNIRLDSEKAVFTKASGETVTRQASTLSTSHKAALLSFTQRPYGKLEKRAVPEEVYSRWEKPWVYKITIDDQPVASEKMVNYKPEDFAHCGWVVVSKAVKERNGYAFELWLWTPEYYEKYKKNHQKRQQQWMEHTKQTLAAFDNI